MPTSESEVMVPGWAFKMFGVMQPLIGGIAIWVGTQMWTLNNQVTVLTVKMESTIQIGERLSSVDQRIQVISERLSRLEGRSGEK